MKVFLYFGFSTLRFQVLLLSTNFIRLRYSICCLFAVVSGHFDVVWHITQSMDHVNRLQLSFSETMLSRTALVFDLCWAAVLFSFYFCSFWSSNSSRFSVSTLKICFRGFAWCR